jgi:hypothetical protein
VRNDATMVSTDEESSTLQKVSEYIHSRGKRVIGIPQWSSLHPVHLVLVMIPVLCRPHTGFVYLNDAHCMDVWLQINVRPVLYRHWKWLESQAGFIPKQLVTSNRQYAINVACITMHYNMSSSQRNDSDIAFNIIGQWQAIRVESNVSDISPSDTYCLSLWREVVCSSLLQHPINLVNSAS